jgi:hypothetical protein
MRRRRDQTIGPRTPGGRALIALLLLAPGATPAEVSLGTRLGYSTAVGDVRGDLAMNRWVDRHIPIQLDVLVRVKPRVSLGAYLSYGIGLPSGDAKDFCELFGCWLPVVRAGVQAVYEHPGRRLVPWAGAGLGYEWNIASFDPRGRQPLNVKLRGVEWLNVQGGADWRLGRRFALGPFLMATLARYSPANAVPGNAGAAASGSGAAIHSWLQLGVRGRVDL